MSLKISTKQAEYAPIPEGSYPAICYSVVDIGQQYNEKFHKTSSKIIITWEICDDDLREDFGRGKLERRAISKTYTASWNEKATLHKDIRPWVGKSFDDIEFFDVANLTGLPCMLGIVNNKGSDGTVYANVSSVSPLMKGIKLGEPENPIITYDMDASDEEVFEQLPEWIQKKIQSSRSPNAKQANSSKVIFDPETGEVLDISIEHTESKSNKKAKGKDGENVLLDVSIIDDNEEDYPF